MEKTELMIELGVQRERERESKSVPSSPVLNHCTKVLLRIVHITFQDKGESLLPNKKGSLVPRGSCRKMYVLRSTVPSWVPEI